MNNRVRVLNRVVFASCALLVLGLAGCSGSQDVSQTPGGGQPTTQITWLQSEPEGLTLAKQENKPILVDFFADWCDPCKEMDKVTFHDKQVVEELARFVAVRADVSRPSSPGQPAAKRYNISAYPTFVLIDTKGQRKTIVGYRDPQEFLTILKGIR